MTSSLIRGRPRRAASHISARVLHTVLGALIGVVWLVLPGMTIENRAPVADGRAQAVAQDQEDSGSSAADLVLPLVTVGAAGAVAGYTYVRRTRRARTRTTPGGVTAAPAAPPPLAELDEQARVLLVAADDSVRTSREELGFVEARFGESAVAPSVLALRGAEAELRAAFRMRQQYDDGVPEEAAARQHALAGIVGRCEEAGRRLDEAAAGVDQLRGLERGAGEALGLAETRFRALTGRVQAVESLLTGLATRYGGAAVAEVTGYAEQAKDRLVFATLRLNQARQAGDLAAHDRAALHLRAAEGAIAQAAVFLHAVERLGTGLPAAAALLPAALTGAEAELAALRNGGAEVPVGELRARLLHADNVLAFVRDEVAGETPYDPLDALRRVVQAVSPLAAEPVAGVLGAAAALAGRAAVAGADDFVATHRGAVGATARTRLAEAARLLGADPVTADALARDARDLAEQDVRVRGNPVAGAAEHESGGAGAVLGGILLDDGAAASFGGPRGRGRRAR
ncbi:hypothetical protein DI272_29485 [Streptomyces sp. Act143]|uniref:hypothetical protein n=1 Tax=Streptomyces sp. Act143 TaxID=2200760 RepID=UPI000D67E831|nr:hypothetical protein [Streptomyces sp. Act143]PWI17833.1 hypothetical protein DI272_29485 [Streptomyces sp. Act143]